MTRNQICRKACRAKNRKLVVTFWDRFWKKVKRSGNCWVWIGSVNGDGYGQVKRNGKAFMVHRLAWEFRHGKLPKGIKVLHSCDNPPCVTDSHLFLGTAQDNVDDCIKKGRRRYARGEQHYNAKLSEGEVETIRNACRNGATKTIVERLSKRFKVHPGHIRNVAYGFRR